MPPILVSFSTSKTRVAVSTISHFEILEKLGEGGMGVVWKARDTRLERLVALKLLPAEKTADPTRRLRFVQEARAASALNHPHIVTIYDIDRVDGADFIAMEFVAGRTLDLLIPGKRMRIGEALKYAIQIADAMAAAHAAGIVHRDLKPGNVMVTEKGGDVKVLDFGLAKLQEDTPISEADDTRSIPAGQPNTEKGTILGTVAYMSPEQAEGKKVDARSDIFSFGVLLYEMLTGRRAFQADTKMATLAAILNREPEPLDKLVPVPRELAHIVRRCLRKEPDRRAHSMQDLKLALEEIKDELNEGSDSGTLAGTPAPSGKAPRKKWAMVASGVVVLAAIGWLATKSSDSRHGPAGPPVIVLMDTTAPSGVYDPDTRQKSGTNADDISDDLRDLPAAIRKETVGSTWNREDQVLKQIPDLIVIHKSAFSHAMIFDFQAAVPPLSDSGNLPLSKATPPPYRRYLFGRLSAVAEDKLEAFLGYVGASNSKTRVLLYSRGAPGEWAEAAYRHDWVQNLERRFPALHGRVFTINVEGRGEASFRAPKTAAQVRQTVQSILKLNSSGATK